MEKTTFKTVVVGTLLTLALVVISVAISPPASTGSVAPLPSPTAASPAGSPIAVPKSTNPFTSAGPASGGDFAKGNPGFTLPDLKGILLSPTNYRGQIVLVNFWATWCGPCRREIPDFIELYRQYHSQGLEILGVALDFEGSRVVKPFSENLGINYPVLIGNAQVQAAYGVNAIPTTLVLDRKGNVHTKLIGAQNRTTLDAVIKSLL